MKSLNDEIVHLLGDTGWEPAYVDGVAKGIIVAGIVLLSWLAAKLFRHLLVPALQRISYQTKVSWDDHLFQDKVMHSASRLIPPIIWYALLPLAFGDMPRLLEVLQKGCQIYLIIVVFLLVNVFLSTLYEISSEHETLRNRPLKGVYQMINLVALCVGGILVISILIGENATSIIAGLGASAAVLILIFKDSILGLVAGVQLSANDMLRPGDWITMTKYGADGYVTEVTLTTVKVQNFDKTITTIPPYVLVSDSFQNWRGMRECGGRRIKRSVLIDANTVRFCSPEELSRLKIQEWMDGEEQELKTPVVNLYLLRRYLRYYLKNHPGVHPELLQMVRMLQPTSEGIPVEIYCFSKNTEWTAYEALQDDIFDHLFAVVPEFGLRIFQRPSGRDFQPLS